MPIAAKEYDTNQGVRSALSKDELVTLLTSLVYFGFADSVKERLHKVIAVHDHQLLDEVLKLEASLLEGRGMQKRSRLLLPKVIEAHVKRLVEEAGHRYWQAA